ncbi:hypothetical protein ACLUEY_07130 [Vreelandella aquamarina]
MKHINAWLIGASLLVSLPLNAATVKDEAMGQIQIEINGTPGMAFSAQWQVTRDGDIQTYQENGQAPTHYAYEGDAIQGRIQSLSEGRLEVSVNKGGNRSRSSTQGKGSTLNISVR